MALVQSNDVVEQVPSAAADPALSNTVLPRAPDGSLRGDDLHGSNRGWNFPSILCIVIKDEELGGRLIGEGLSQLLGNNHYQQPERADQPPERCGQWKLLYRARKYHALWVQSRRQGEMYLLGDLHTHEQGHHQGCHHHYRRCAHQPADRWLDWHGSVIVFAAKGAGARSGGQHNSALPNRDCPSRREVSTSWRSRLSEVCARNLTTTPRDFGLL